MAGEASPYLLREGVRVRRPERAEGKQAALGTLSSPGVLPPSGRREAERPFLEADGCTVSLKRERRKKRELKAGVSCEGWSRAGEERWRTKSRPASLSAAGASLCCWSADLAAVHDHAGMGEIAWSSDGASRLQRGPDPFSLSHARPDRLHFERPLVPDRGFSGEAFPLLGLACRGRAAEVVSSPEKQLEKATDGREEADGRGHPPPPFPFRPALRPEEGARGGR